jgi:hypothetical protein
MVVFQLEILIDFRSCAMLSSISVNSAAWKYHLWVHCSPNPRSLNTRVKEGVNISFLSLIVQEGANP